MNSSEVYLYLIGPNGSVIEGDVEAKHYEKQIALSTWQWKAALASFSRSDGKVDQVTGGGLTLSKLVDPASITMFKLLETGEACQKATITMLQRTEHSIALRVALHNVRFDKVKLDVSTQEHVAVATEDWVVSFDKIEIFYKGDNTQNVGQALKNKELTGAVIYELNIPKERRTSSSHLDDDILSGFMSSSDDDDDDDDSRYRQDDAMFGYE